MILKEKETVNIPISFLERKIGPCITKSKLYRGEIRVWDVKANKILGHVDLLSKAPGYVRRESISCFIPQGTQKAPMINSPNISLSVTPVLVMPGDTVHVQWSVSNGSEITLQKYACEYEVLPAGWVGGGAGYGGQPINASGSFDEVVWQSTMYEIDALVAGSGQSASVNAHIKVPVGYYNARVPGGYIPEDELTSVRNWLMEIEQKLKQGCITGNQNLDRFNDPYLRDSNGLTKDILTKMQNVVICLHRHQMIDAVLAGGLLIEKFTLCDSAKQVMGQTWDSNIVGICLDLGADNTTLLHELYHYSATHDQENCDKGYAISVDPGGCF